MIASAASAILPVSAVSAASAGTVQTGMDTPHTVTAVTHLSYRGDSGGGGNDWANDFFTRTAKVTFRGVAPLSDCGSGATTCYAYTASLSDKGRFQTISGQLAPNQGAYPGSTVLSAAWGHMHGYGLFTTFYESALPNKHLVPRHVTGSTDPSYLWPGLFFPVGSYIMGLNENDWGYYYKAPHDQTWADTSYNGGGQVSSDGNITG